MTGRDGHTEWPGHAPGRHERAARLVAGPGWYPRPQARDGPHLPARGHARRGYLWWPARVHLFRREQQGQGPRRHPRLHLRPLGLDCGTPRRLAGRRAASAHCATSAGSAAYPGGGGAEVGATITDLRFIADEVTNAVIVTTYPRLWKEIDETIKKLDRPARQVLIEVLVAEVTLNDDTKLGIEWAVRSGKFTFTNTQNTLANSNVGVTPTPSGTGHSLGRLTRGPRLQHVRGPANSSPRSMRSPAKTRSMCSRARLS